MIRALRRFKDPMAAPPYLSLFKLREAPFASPADAKYFYSDPERAQTLNMLQHLTQYSEELLLVCGPDGAGKSSLLEQYLSRADDDWKVCRVNAAELTEPAALFLAAARCFGLTTDGIASEQLLPALQAHLNELQQSMMPVLVVDEAQRLSDDALEIVVRLAELPGEHGRLVRVLLFADPAIRQRFGSARFASAPQPHVLELKPLDEAHTIAYLQHRLGTAGYGGGPLFQPKEIKRIHKLSAGWPGGINAMAHEVLMSKQKATGSSHWKYVTLAAVAVGAAAGGYFMLGTHVNGAEGEGHAEVSAPASHAPERPIVRHNAEPAPLQTALVVRSGETLQITCAAPAAAGAAAAPATLPLLREAAPATVAAEHDAAVALPKPAPAPAPASTAAVATAGEGSQAAAPVVPEGVAPTAEPAPEHAAAAVEHAAPPAPTPVSAAVTAPHIEALEPNPVPASGGKVEVKVVGQHFVAHSEVTVSGKGRRRTLPAEQVRVLDAQHMTIEFNPGMSAAELTLTVAAADGQASEPFHFKVEPPKPVAEPVQETAPATAAAAAPVPASEAVPAAPAPAALPVPPVPSAPVAEPPQAAAAKAAEPVVPVFAGFRSAAWLRAQDPGRYTVQLVGATTEAAVREHLHGYNVTGDIALLLTQRAGKPWYVVFWGDFASREEAQQVVGTLPADLRKASPWIRPFADVHKEIAQGIPAAR